MIECDMAQADAVHRAADQIVQRWGPPDVWVNNAMLSVFAQLGATGSGG